MSPLALTLTGVFAGAAIGYVTGVARALSHLVDIGTKPYILKHAAAGALIGALTLGFGPVAYRKIAGTSSNTAPKTAITLDCTKFTPPGAIGAKVAKTRDGKTYCDYDVPNILPPSMR